MTSVWIILIAFSCGSAAAAGRTVEAIEVVVQSANGGVLSPMIQKRMQASVQTIASHVLAGRSLAEVASRKMGDENLIREVFDRILIGYTVREVEIEPAVTAKVRVTVIPWQDVIERVYLQVKVEDMPEEIAQMARSDVKNAAQVFEQVLVGLPMDAADWTSGIIKENLNDFLAVHLPEFRADFELRAGTETEVLLSLYPKGAVIRDIKVSMRSESIPNLLLYNLRPAMQRQSELLVGVPTGFVERHKAYFINLFSERLNAEKNLQALGAKIDMELRVDTNAELRVETDTDKYNISVEGYLDVGREEDNTSFRLHAGKFISSRDEIYLEADFFPHRVKWVLMPGLSRKITPRATVGFKYDLNENANILWAKQRLDDRWLLRFEHTPRFEENEFAVRYQVHDFVALEYIFSDEDNWLRVIGNF